MSNHLAGLSREQRRKMMKDLHLSNSKFQATLQIAEIPENRPLGLIKLWRSRKFLVQLYAPEKENFPHRLSINRTQIDQHTGRWVDGITWEDIQSLKREAGFGDCDCVEIYPADCDLVESANIRHIWLLGRCPWAWRNPISEKV